MDAAAARQTNLALARLMERLSRSMVRETYACWSLVVQLLAPTAVQTTRHGLCVRLLSIWCESILPRV